MSKDINHAKYSRQTKCFELFCRQCVKQYKFIFRSQQTYFNQHRIYYCAIEV